jgi:hypothetical protein
MTQIDWLIRYIAKAFEGVALDDGIDIHTAQSMEDYGNPAEDRLSRNAECKDWKRVTLETLEPRFWGVVNNAPWLDNGHASIRLRNIQNRTGPKH